MSSKLTLRVLAVAAVLLLGPVWGASAVPWWEKSQLWTLWIPPSAALLPPNGTWPPDQPCSTQDCVIVRELLERENVITRALRVPTMGETETVYPAWLTRELSVPYVRRELRREVFAYPRRFTAWCARMRQFAASYTGPGEDREDYRFMRDLLDLAELIDRRGKGGCLSGVLNAFPTPHPDLVEDAEYLCIGGQWRARSCKRIKVPVRALSSHPARQP